MLIGMDTPQVTPGLLETVAQPLTSGEADAVFGPAADGGFWLLGLRQPDAELIRGVPMSADHTGRVQLDRLRAAGLRIRQVPELIDVDTVDDAVQVAGQAPGSRFAATLGHPAPAARPGDGQHRPASSAGHRRPRSASPRQRGRGADGLRSEEARNERPERRGKEAPQGASGGARRMSR